MINPILTAHGLTKRYGKVTAIEDSDLNLFPGEVLAIIGDNGAGKSTLIKALSGAIQADQGKIMLEGNEVVFSSPIEARKYGIETVHQTLALSPALSIAENEGRWQELKRQATTAQLYDVNVEILNPSEVKDKYPGINNKDLKKL